MLGAARPHRCEDAAMRLDPTDYLQLDAPQCIGTTSAGATFATSSGDIVEIECFGDGAFRLRSGPNTRPDYGIVARGSQPCRIDVAQSRRWSFDAGRAALEISGPPLALRLTWQGRSVLTSATDENADGSARLPALSRLRHGGLWSAAFALASGEAVYGLGEKFGGLDKRGQIVHSRVAQVSGVNSGLSSRSTPLAWCAGSGAGAWGAFVHTPGTVTHAVGNPDWSHRSYAIMVEDEALDLFLFAAADPAGILDLYTQVTGRPRVVPRWSLGLWLGRPGAAGPEDAEALVARMRERRLPCDAVSFGVAGAGSAGEGFDFTWDPLRYPDPAQALAAIKAHRVRVCLRETPTITVESPLYDQLASSQCLLTGPDGEPCVITSTAAREPSARGSALVDFTVPEACAWWRDAHRGCFEDGIDAFECEGGEAVPDNAIASNGDGGARLHNVYPLLYHRCVWEATERFAPPGSVPPVLASHAGWSAAHTLPFGFAGVAQADWEGLAASIRGALAWAMSGNACHGLSIGAHPPTHPPGAELFVRWLQAAMFASHVRLVVPHGREPWQLGAEIEAIARKWIVLRYRLIPYLERCVVQAAESGLPVMRAMPLAFPESVLTRGFDTQFMCGDALLVAPIVREGGEVTVALPAGAWYDLNTRERHAGPRVLRYVARLDQFPVFGREGHTLPLGPAIQHTGEADGPHALEAVWIFGAPQSRFEARGQAFVGLDDAGAPIVRVGPGIDVQVFGDGAAIAVQAL